MWRCRNSLDRGVAKNRVVSHLRFTGHFIRTFQDTQGNKQPIDFIATDILRVRDEKITDNWYVDDNLTFPKQIGANRSK